ncbi:hypothetical protein [Criblamydia sequanensis]|nr:hypothetical protein [Criblamydia sequanensis]
MFPNLVMLAGDKNIEVVAVKKASFKDQDSPSKTLFIKHLDCGDLCNGNFNRYLSEGRIAFIIDGKRVQVNESLIENNFAESISKVKFKDTELKSSSLENVEIIQLTDEEYDEILEVCQDIIRQAQLKNAQVEEQKKRGKESSKSRAAVHLAIKEMIIQSLLKQMNRITENFLKAMQDAIEKENKAAHEYEIKMQIVREKLLKERLSKERLHEVEKQVEILKTEISKEKKQSIKRKTGVIVAEQLA